MVRRAIEVAEAFARGTDTVWCIVPTVVKHAAAYAADFGIPRPGVDPGYYQSAATSAWWAADYAATAGSAADYADKAIFILTVCYFLPGADARAASVAANADIKRLMALNLGAPESSVRPSTPPRRGRSGPSGRTGRRPGTGTRPFLGRRGGRLDSHRAGLCDRPG